ncbi:DUF2207 domain-containing protein [Acidaminobacter sp. JC074]|uniref:hypothetical protein n=1 Tax=Acidaminobacter sp. JC074 TaxID=2530199 RepID=UPI001F117E53|nr:hypothetical protein [Acidaminobacter sp. JC074]MCH4886037.1 DUF2207 domain-containing protein [Acidaminobacter sp. JC074]
MKLLRSEGYIKVNDSTETIKEKLKVLAYQQMLSVNKSPLTDKPFLGHFSGNQVHLELLKSDIRLLRPEFDISINESYDESILNIKAYPNKGIDKLIKSSIIACAVLLILSIIPVFFEALMALVLIPVLIFLVQAIGILVVLIFVFKSYINKEYKKAFTLIRKALEVDDEKIQSH